MSENLGVATAPETPALQWVKSVDYEAAYHDAKRILTPGRGRGTVRGDIDAWRLARAQWFYDFGSRALAERELKNINEYRASRDWDKPGTCPPLDLRRSRVGQRGSK
jgi:hypothetical protein